MAGSTTSAMKSPKVIGLSVLLIVAFGLIAYNVAGLFSDPSTEPADPITETRRSMGEIPARVGAALSADAPATSLDALPPIEGWKNATVDEWKNPFTYEVKRLPNNNYTVRVQSNGPDGQAGTEDDIIMNAVLEHVALAGEWVPGLTEYEGPEFSESGGN